MALYKQIFIIYQTAFAYFFNFFKKIIWQLKKIEAKYYFNSRQKQIAVILLIVIAGIFLFSHPAAAVDIEGAVRGIINWLCLTLIVVFGKLLNMLISFLMEIAKYNNFIYAPVVAKGWILTRDVCNMFFVIVLLVIAFATVLRIQTYSYKNLLKKLIIMALLINFSKTICGFLIDFAQVIMLTFVNAFRNAGYNLVEMLKLTKTLEMAQAGAGGQPVDDWNITGALVIGLLLLIVASVVVLIFLLVLLARIVYLWLLVTLSPLAFFLSSFPGGQQYASRWWDYFTKQLVVGPLLAFFLWLSLASASGGLNVTTTEGYTGQEGYTISEENILQGKTGGTEAAQSFASEALTPTNMLSFIVSIALLLAGLVIAQEAGGLTGSIAGKGLAKIQSTGTGILTGKVGPTPMRWARERIKAYTGMREDLRKQKAMAGGAKLLALEGGIRKGVTAPVRGITEGVRGAIDKRFEEPKRLREEARSLRLQGKEKEAIKLESRAKESEARLAERKVFTPLMITRRYWDKKGEVQDSYASQLREEGNTAEALKFEKRAGHSRGIGKSVQLATTGGAAFASLLGGPLAGAGLSLLGGKFLNWQGKYQAKEGERYQDRARNWKYHEITQAKDRDKNKDDYTLKTRSEDPSMSPIDRMADILLRLENGKYSSAEVGKLKAQMQTLGADQSTLSNFDRLVVEKFPQHSTRFNVDEVTNQPLEPAQIIKKIAEAIKGDDLKPFDFASSSLTSRGGMIAYAILQAVETGQLKRLAEKSPDFKEKLGQGSGDYLVNIVHQLDNETIRELSRPENEEGQKQLSDIEKTVGRHFYTATKKNRFNEIFGVQENGTITNDELLKHILSTDDGIELIANINLQKLNDQQRETVINFTINNANVKKLNSAFAAAEGKKVQEEWMEKILTRILQIKDQLPSEFVNYLIDESRKNTALSRYEKAKTLKTLKKSTEKGSKTEKSPESETE